ncbi:obscurin-like isoform X5 [Cherax quadricarinatus]|uniref:obscurin-like isoform X5 n=1 Tax=Cherax quadricarinatus TaxID=27406 RepID=UPI00387E3BB8
MGDNFAPSFTQKPKLRQEDDGNKLIFDCKLSASPQPSIEWFRGEESVKESSRIKITIKPGTGRNIHDVQLILDDVEEEDAGLYKVKAKNKYGEVSASINLNFSPNEQPTDLKQIDGLAPTFAQKPVIKQEEGGKHIKFECRILADPKPAITWFRDGLKVQESARCKVMIEKDEKSYFVTMALTNVTVEDAGKYKVTAKNELGESNATISLNFDSSFMMLTADEAPLPSKEGVRPTFTERPCIKQSEDGSSVIFSCRCVGSPQPTIVWEFKGKKLREGARHKMKIEPDGKVYFFVLLEISKVSNADEGEYKAIATNKLGEGVATINLHFEGKTASDKPKIPDGKAPRFPKKPEIRQEGDKLVMECVLEANPEPEVTWFKGNEMVQEQGRISIYKKICGKDQYIVSVTIMKPEASDGGQWRCNAFNPFGDSNANIALNFEKGKAIPEGFAPTFLDKPSIIPNESGTMITMKVRCKAKPQPTVEWFKDGNKLEAAKRLVIKEHKVTAEMFEYSCIVKKPQPTDGGVYKCNIKNEFGELNANLNLNIEVAPTIKRPPKIVSVFNKKVVIECVIMSTSKPACSWYKDSTKVRLDSRHCVNINEEGEGKYVVQMEMIKAEKFDCGSYKVVAKNEKGETTSQTVELTQAMLEEVSTRLTKT